MKSRSMLRFERNGLKYLLLLIIFLPAVLSSAQSTTPARKVASMQDNLLIALGITQWTTVPEGIEVNILQSREFGFLFMAERMIPSGAFGLGMGIGFSSQNFHTNALINAIGSDSATSLTVIPPGVDYSVNKMSLNFVDAQVEIRVHSKRNASGNRFKFSAGCKGGILLQSHTKLKDDKATYKKSAIPHLNKYQVGVNARIGYAYWGLGAYYSLTEIFQSNEGPELVPYSISLYLTL